MPSIKGGTAENPEFPLCVAYVGHIRMDLRTADQFGDGRLPTALIRSRCFSHNTGGLIASSCTVTC